MSVDVSAASHQCWCFPLCVSPGNAQFKYECASKKCSHMLHESCHGTKQGQRAFKCYPCLWKKKEKGDGDSSAAAEATLQVLQEKLYRRCSCSAVLVDESIEKEVQDYFEAKCEEELQQQRQCSGQDAARRQLRKKKRQNYAAIDRGVAASLEASFEHRREDFRKAAAETIALMKTCLLAHVDPQYKDVVESKGSCLPESIAFLQLPPNARPLTAVILRGMVVRAKAVNAVLDDFDTHYEELRYRYCEDGNIPLEECRAKYKIDSIAPSYYLGFSELRALANEWKCVFVIVTGTQEGDVARPCVSFIGDYVYSCLMRGDYYTLGLVGTCHYIPIVASCPASVVGLSQQASQDMWADIMKHSRAVRPNSSKKRHQKGGNAATFMSNIQPRGGNVITHEDGSVHIGDIRQSTSGGEGGNTIINQRVEFHANSIEQIIVNATAAVHQRAARVDSSSSIGRDVHHAPPTSGQELLTIPLKEHLYHEESSKKRKEATPKEPLTEAEADKIVTEWKFKKEQKVPVKFKLACSTMMKCKKWSGQQLLDYLRKIRKDNRSAMDALYDGKRVVFHKWHSQHEALVKEYLKPGGASIKRVRKAPLKNEPIENAVLSIFEQLRQQGCSLPFNTDTLTSIWQHVLAQLYGSSHEDLVTESDNLETELSKTARVKKKVQRMLKRHNFKFKKLYGEVGSVDINSPAFMEAIALIRSILADVPPDCVYNMDECGLFYQRYPDHQYVADEEAGRGSKLSASKNRVTLSVCCNADGSHKLPVYVLGKTKRPTCYLPDENMDTPSVHYDFNKSGWMTTPVFNAYLMWFWNHVCARGTPRRRTVLVVDNCPSHVDFTNPCPQLLSVVFLPPNSTSLIQPMDQGIIRTLKWLYRSILSNTCFQYIIQGALRQRTPEITAAVGGIRYGYLPNQKDCNTILGLAWDKVTREVITNCFIKGLCHPECTILSREAEQLLKSTSQKWISRLAQSDVPEAPAVEQVEESAAQLMQDSQNELMSKLSAFFEHIQSNTTTAADRVCSRELYGKLMDLQGEQRSAVIREWLGSDDAYGQGLSTEEAVLCVIDTYCSTFGESEDVCQEPIPTADTCNREDDHAKLSDALKKFQDALQSARLNWQSTCSEIRTHDLLHTASNVTCYADSLSNALNKADLVLHPPQTLGVQRITSFFQPRDNFGAKN